MFRPGGSSEDSLARNGVFEYGRLDTLAEGKGNMKLLQYFEGRHLYRQAVCVLIRVRPALNRPRDGRELAELMLAIS